MITHLLHSSIIALALTGVYYWGLKSRHHFQFNRWYLISIPVWSILLPYCTIDFGLALPTLQEVIAPAELYTHPTSSAILDTIVLGESTKAPTHGIAWMTVLIAIYGIIVTLLFMRFMFPLKVLYGFIKSGNRIDHKGARLIYHKNISFACSFFGYIFIPTHVNAQQKAIVLEHEYVHYREGHTYDHLALSLLKILFWWHPVPYLLHKELRLQHEYIADAACAKTHQKSYSYQLLNQLMNTQEFTLTHSFSHPKTIKNRIAMLHPTQKKNSLSWKLLLVLPIIATSLLVNTLSAQTSRIAESYSIIDDVFYIKEDISNYEILVGTGETTNTEALFKLMKEHQPSITSPAALKEKYAILLSNQKEQRLHYVIVNDEKQVIAFLPISSMLHEMKDETQKEDFVIWAIVNYPKTKFGPIKKGTIDQLEREMNIMDMLTEKVEIEETTPPNYEEREEVMSVPFSLIERVPRFPGCEGDNNDVLKECMSQKISEIVGNNFNTAIATQRGIKGIIKIHIQFEIDTNGNVTDIKGRSTDQALTNEAIRVVRLLPKMTPGEQRNRPVGVIYSLPIVFKVEKEPTKKQ